MQCKRAPAHRIQSKETSTSTSMQGDQISNTSIYSEQIHISTNHNILEQFIQTSNFVISSFFQRTLDLVFFSLLSVGRSQSQSQSQLLAHSAR